jgi:selenide,water dikinase
LGGVEGVHAMTDVTGFGLAGHLIEMCQASKCSAELNSANIKCINGAVEYASQGVVPDATYRNWNAFSPHISFEDGVDVAKWFTILPDPQTNGGLLVAVAPDAVKDLSLIFEQFGLQDFLMPIGKMVDETGKTVIVKA